MGDLALTPAREGLDAPVLSHAGDGSGRLFIVEQTGASASSRTASLLRHAVPRHRRPGQPGLSEQGLLGLAFHPTTPPAATSTSTTPTQDAGDTVVARYHVSADDANRADPASELPVLAARRSPPQPQRRHARVRPRRLPLHRPRRRRRRRRPARQRPEPRHAARQDPAHRRRQRPGAALRDPRRQPVRRDGGGARRDLGATACATPGASASTAQTGDLCIGDVGQEPDRGDRLRAGRGHGGQNYGWNDHGGHALLRAATSCDPTGLTLPVAEYDPRRAAARSPAATSTAAQRVPAWHGVYFYGDYCSGRIGPAVPTAAAAWTTVQVAQPHRHLLPRRRRGGRPLRHGFVSGTVYR